VADMNKNGILAQFLIHCQKTSLSEETINTKYKVLRVMLANDVNLEDPDQVKIFIHNRE
jgi:glucose-6-phosphate-specific signal transduction histidine kinase